MTGARTGPEPNTIIPATISHRSVSGLNRIGSVEAGAETRAGTGPKPNAVVPSTVSRWFVSIRGAVLTGLPVGGRSSPASPSLLDASFFRPRFQLLGPCGLLPWGRT
jgi:hypothetical protein